VKWIRTLKNFLFFSSSDSGENRKWDDRSIMTATDGIESGTLWIVQEAAAAGVHCLFTIQNVETNGIKTATLSIGPKTLG
jgi:hypothetical protein